MPLPKRIVKVRRCRVRFVSHKETENLRRDAGENGILAEPTPSNPRHFYIAIKGPSESPFEGGTFRLELFLPADYPMGPPKVRFLTKIYHPNIDKIGRICLDVIKDKWSPALQIRTVLLSVQALLCEPVPDDPLDNGIAEQWKTNLAQAQKTAREWTKLYAK